jgi:chlorite dismutase
MDPLDPPARPPVTLDGWFALHQTFALERRTLRSLTGAALHSLRGATTSALAALAAPNAGWSAVVQLVASEADVLFVHFRPTLDELAVVQREIARLELAAHLRHVDAFLGVTELGLYDLAEADEARVAAERETTHARRRLFPARPEHLPYVSFYPTSKRRKPAQNWYLLPLAERSALMHRHGLVGRRHAARVRQIITGCIGLDAWEWGVTLFAADPLAFKQVVTEMRYDETSAQYADFGPFYVGRVVDMASWAQSLGA